MKRLLMALVALLVIYPSSAMAQDKPQPAPKSETTVTVAATGNASPTVTVNAPPAQAPAPATNVSAPAPTANNPPAGQTAVVLSLKGESGAPRHLLRPFTKRPVTQNEFAQAVRECDKKVLNVDCDEFVREANKKHELDLNLNDKELARSYVADYIRDALVPAQLVAKKGFFDAAMPDGSIVPNGVQRDTLVDERGLANPNTGKCFASLNCGNLCGEGVKAEFTKDNSPVGANVYEPDLKNLRESIEEIARRIATEGDRAKEKKVDSHWYTPTPVKVGIAAGVGLAVVCAIVPGHCVMKQTQKVNQTVCVNGGCYPR